MIVFDLQALQSAAHGERGIGRYVFELARTLHTEQPEAVDIWAWNDRLPTTVAIDRLELGDRLRPFSELAHEEVDVLHVNSAFEASTHEQLMPPCTPRRLLVTCYDLIPYRFAEAYLADAGASARYRTRLGMLLAADAVVVDSQSAANDLIELLGVAPRRLTVIGAGVGALFVPPSDAASARIERLVAAVPGIEPGFVLVPAGMDWRKNASGALAAYARLEPALRAKHQLVIACETQPGWAAWIRMLAADAGVEDRVVLPGRVSDELLVTLNQTAELVMFPSIYEGFGLPVLEALHCGARVIASEASSLPEIVRDRRALFDPNDIDAMSRSLASALGDRRLGARLGGLDQARSSWSATAAKLVDVYRRLAT